MKKYIFHLAIFFIIFQGCNDNIDFEKDNSNSSNINVVELTKYEYASIAHDTPKEIGENAIIDLVKDFIINQSLVDTKSNKNVKICLEDKYFISNNKGLVTKSNPKYEIPILKMKVSDRQSEGVAYVCADERFPLLMAYIPIVKDTILDDSFGCNLMLKHAEDVILEQEGIFNYIRDSLRKSTLEKLGYSTTIDIIDIESIKKNIVINNKSTKSSIVENPAINNRVLSKIGPFISTQWAQHTPYNNQLGGSCPDWFGDPQNYQVSAIVVSVAQILGYFEPYIYTSGITMNWSYLKQKSTIVEPNYFNQGDPIDRRNMVAALMKFCSDKCQISYTCSNSSYYMSNVINFLKSYNITIDSQRNFDFAAIRTSLNNAKLAICHGRTSSNGGHSWIIDGYMDISVGNSLSNYTTWVHANMGMGNYYDGYYLVNSNTGLTFDVGFAHFNNNIIMYNNIGK